MKKSALTLSERLLPSLDEIIPPQSAPMQAPAGVEPTMKPRVSESLGTWKSFCMKASAPEMTPVSNPNISPATAAMRHTKSVNLATFLELMSSSLRLANISVSLTCSSAIRHLRSAGG